MNAHFMRHKHRLSRFAHQTFHPGETMARFPLLVYNKRQPDQRAKLAAALKAMRNDPQQRANFLALACF